MEGMAGRRSSRLGACARKRSVKHMVRACSTNQPVLRLSIGSLALITATRWAPGCPSELLGQAVGGDCELGEGQSKEKQQAKRGQQKGIRVKTDELGEVMAGRWVEDNDVRLHRHKTIIGREHCFVFICYTQMIKRIFTDFKLTEGGKKGLHWLCSCLFIISSNGTKCDLLPFKIKKSKVRV